MAETLHEECGIAAVYQLDQATAEPVNVTHYLPNMLLDLQNRGQLAAGMTTFSESRNRLLQTHKDIGNVGQVFRMYHARKHLSLLEKYEGTAAIGHVRYATSGKENRNFAQPFERVHGRKWKWFSIAFNGNLANYDDLKDKLISKGYHITYHTDTEVMMHYFNKELRGEVQRDYREIFASLAEQFDGAFTIAFLNACGELVLMRGPQGIKPLVYGVHNNLLFAASESVALSRLGVTDYKDLDPGCILVVTKQGWRIERYTEHEQKAHCFFEWVYFANLASKMDGQSVYKARRNLGIELAKNEPIQDFENAVVVPVPETATFAGDSYGFMLGIPVIEALIRNRYVGRTFIEGESRDAAIKRKFTLLTEVIEGKRVFIVDDSLVRSKTLKAIVRLMRTQCNVKELHVRIACPPIVAPCFYGIDIPTITELFAPKFRFIGDPLRLSEQVLKTMANDLNADSLNYLSIESVCKAIGFSANELCLGCVSGHYPTPTGQQTYNELLEKFQEVHADPFFSETLKKPLITA